MLNFRDTENTGLVKWSSTFNTMDVQDQEVFLIVPEPLEIQRYAKIDSPFILEKSFPPQFFLGADEALWSCQ